ALLDGEVHLGSPTTLTNLEAGHDERVHEPARPRLLPALRLVVGDRQLAGLARHVAAEPHAGDGWMFALLGAGADHVNQDSGQPANLQGSGVRIEVGFADFAAAKVNPAPAVDVLDGPGDLAEARHGHAGRVTLAGGEDGPHGFCPLPDRLLFPAAWQL